MNTNEITGIILSVVILTLGLLKIELIKSFVARISKSKINSGAFSFFFLAIVSIIPAFLGKHSNQEVTPPALEMPENIPSTKNDIEASLEIAKVIGTAGKELIDEQKQNNRIKDSTYLANRDPWWVYRISDIMDNDKAIFDLYRSLDQTSNVCLFKDKNEFFLFYYTHSPKKLLEDSLAEIATLVGHRLTLVDLAEYCRRDRPQIKRTDNYKLGRRKNKVMIVTFSPGK